MSIKKAYRYFYYQMYRAFGTPDDSWWLEWRAYAATGLFECSFLYSLLVYYTVFIDRDTTDKLPDSNLWIYIGVGIVCFFNYMVFMHKDQWKAIVEEFNQLPKKKNRLGGWIVFGVVLVMLFSLVFAFYLLSKVGVNRVS